MLIAGARGGPHGELSSSSVGLAPKIRARWSWRRRQPALVAEGAGARQIWSPKLGCGKPRRHACGRFFQKIYAQIFFIIYVYEIFDKNLEVRTSSCTLYKEVATPELSVSGCVLH
jgi:hypothetical protein